MFWRSQWHFSFERRGGHTVDSVSSGASNSSPAHHGPGRLTHDHGYQGITRAERRTLLLA
ncbi:hypothetical protein SALB1_0118 [Salinisphaera sp. LB1]|nr:hypothetical protein SALB1_0118 [Salinisphaera sp. LB1]